MAHFSEVQIPVMSFFAVFPRFSPLFGNYFMILGAIAFNFFSHSSLTICITKWLKSAQRPDII
jgi:hypothetical protein